MMNLALIDASLRGNFHPHYDWSLRDVDEDGSEEMSDYSRRNCERAQVYQ
jgi:hypothetical protein